MTFRTLALPSLSLVFGLAALGCSGESDPPGSTEQEDTEHCTEDLVGVVDPTFLIDDLEDKDPLIAAVGERNGTWWLATDMTDGTVTPAGDQEAPPERILGGRCGSKYAMRVSGEGFKAWGASLVLNFRLDADALAPIDASAFRGVMMWARVGESNTSPVRVQFQDGNTYPEGGVCNPDPDASDGCFNGYGSALVPVSTEWQLYKFEFSRMGQRDFGLRGNGLDLTTLYAIEIGVVQETVFDFWVDDVWFYE
jgi:hypothetical protein